MTNHPISPPSSIAGVILAGGRSRRMAGSNKVFCQVGGQSLLQCCIDRLAPQVQTLAINANLDLTDLPDDWRGVSLPIIADTQGEGPLAGIAAAMAWASENRQTEVVTVAVDTPFFPTDFVIKMDAKRRQSGAQIVTARSLGRSHPTIAMWSVEGLTSLHQALARDVRKIDSWTKTRPHSFLDWPDASPHNDPFFNINTPQDLELAQTMTTQR